VHQVMLEVRVSEMSRALTKRLSVNWSYDDGGDFGVGLIGQLVTIVQPDDANVPAGNLGFWVPQTMNTLFRFHTGQGMHTAMIDALKGEGLIKILAEPTLIAVSGQTATFLAGGEFPVPVPQGLGTVAIEYKPFGVGLTFTPTILSEKKISIRVVPEVSELDFSASTRLEGYVIPGLTTRRASTVVELADGQSFAIAGLLKDNLRDEVSKYPFLGDIPVLGNLFRSRAYMNNETELIIIVTPKLVKPLDGKEAILPTNFYMEPNDLDFYLVGSMQGIKEVSSPITKTELDGNFGHSIPMLEE